MKKTITPLPQGIKIRVNISGSKSLTHRALITAALAEGTSHLKNILLAEDTLLTIKALREMGIKVNISNNKAVVQGSKGKLAIPKKPIYLGNSGTSMRLLTAICALGKGNFCLAGNKRMQQRPIGPLLDALNMWRVKAYSKNKNGCPPVIIKTDGIWGGETEIDTTISSQFLSGLLLVAPYTKKEAIIKVKGPLASKPYVDLTILVMETFGVSLEKLGYRVFKVKRGHYRACDYVIEGDCSTACYFWAAAAILKGEVTVRPISYRSKQADIGFVKILEKMGCKIRAKNNSITVRGGGLRGINVDMNAIPDAVPILAIVSAFSQGKTIISNVAHLRHKECDRLHALSTELQKMKINVEEKENGLIIEGGKPYGAKIETYNDHRIAMSFAIAGLRVPGVVIKNPDCVKKSFPTFWQSPLFSKERYKQK
jgi:3-phosphoshikimate 1-carboxyvinyltransferase